MVNNRVHFVINFNIAGIEFFDDRNGFDQAPLFWEDEQRQCLQNTLRYPLKSDFSSE